MLSSAYSCINMPWLLAIMCNLKKKAERFAWPVITMKKPQQKRNSASHDRRTTGVGTLSDYQKMLLGILYRTRSPDKAEHQDCSLFRKMFTKKASSTEHTTCNTNLVSERMETAQVVQGTRTQ